MKYINSLSSIIDSYDALILDLWGVVHDGTHLYPGILEVLRELKAAGKKVIFLSNAPRRAHKVVAVLEQLGVGSALYQEAMSSGEMGYRWLAQELRWGPDYYYIGPSKDADVVDGLEYKRLDDIKLADFLLNVGFGSEEQNSDDWMPLLRAAKGQSLPMLCLNPDLEVVKQSGERFACAGELAGRYAQLGGEVKWFGKPYPEVYDYCLHALGTTKERVLAIGDSLHTDIQGAVDADIDCVLVTGGILKPQAHRIEELCREHQLAPDFIMPELLWNMAGDKLEKAL
ncbi:MAG: TIGR01459 family HAD-type hydrolase [Alphaproteobacteria bacterium]